MRAKQVNFGVPMKMLASFCVDCQKMHLTLWFVIDGRLFQDFWIASAGFLWRKFSKHVHILGKIIKDVLLGLQFMHSI